MSYSAMLLAKVSLVCVILVSSMVPSEARNGSAPIIYPYNASDYSILIVHPNVFDRANMANLYWQFGEQMYQYGLRRQGREHEIRPLGTPQFFQQVFPNPPSYDNFPYNGMFIGRPRPCWNPYCN